MVLEEMESIGHEWAIHRISIESTIEKGITLRVEDGH
jgi:hypothetical protein